MRQCAPIKRLVDGDGGGGGEIKGGGAWGTTAWAEGRCHGRMFVVISVLPRREGDRKKISVLPRREWDPIRRMKTMIVTGGNAARYAITPWYSDGTTDRGRCTPIIRPLLADTTIKLRWRVARTGEVSVFVGGMGWWRLLERGRTVQQSNKATRKWQRLGGEVKRAARERGGRSGATMDLICGTNFRAPDGIKLNRAWAASPML